MHHDCFFVILEIFYLVFNPTEKHMKAFNQIKEMLIREPLFGNLINEKAEKYLLNVSPTSQQTVYVIFSFKSHPSLMQTYSDKKYLFRNPVCD